MINPNDFRFQLPATTDTPEADREDQESYDRLVTDTEASTPIRQAVAIYVDGAARAEAEAIKAEITRLFDQPGFELAVEVVVEPVFDLVHVEGVGWVCPTCWERSDHSDRGNLKFVETVGETRSVSDESTAECLALDNDWSTEGFDAGPIEPRIWCRGCVTRYVLPDGIHIDWG